MIVDTCEVVGHLSLALIVLHQTLHVRLDLVETIRLLVVVHEHVRINFVNEDLIVEI